MKKTLSIILAVFIVFSLSGCFGSRITTVKIDSVNQVAEVATKCSVKIKTVYYNGFVPTGEVSVGSGAVFCQETNKYYIITNNHVVNASSAQDKKYYVIDSYGNEYQASLYKNSKDDDLAVLTIRSSDVSEKMADLNVLEISTVNPAINTVVFALTCPGGVINSLTIGQVLEYKTVDVEEQSSDIKYAVITHSAKIKNGSSGGMLIDSNMKIVGVNFAGASDESGTFVEAYAVPAVNVYAYVRDILESE